LTLQYSLGTGILRRGEYACCYGNESHGRLPPLGYDGFVESHKRSPIVLIGVNSLRLIYHAQSKVINAFASIGSSLESEANINQVADEVLLASVLFSS
jgi:hypothetical protein